MSRWFRHYAGLARDDKLVSAAMKSKQPIERVVWVWIAILESASEIDDGGRYKLDHAEVAWFLRLDESDLVSIEDALHTLGRVDGGCVTKWTERQFKSDRSAERQKRYRDGLKTSDKAEVAPSRDGGVTSPSRHRDAPETETETETEKKEVLPSEACPPPQDETALALEAYNSAASETGWAKAGKLAPARKAPLKARLAECGGIDGWRDAMAKARASPFLCGVNDRGWLPSLDFFLQAKSFTKLIEGAYDARKPDSQPNASSRRPSGADALMAAGIEEIERIRRTSVRVDSGADYGRAPRMDSPPLLDYPSGLSDRH